MTVFFIISPTQIMHRVLPLIREKKFDDLTIVTTEDLVPFLRKYVKAKIIVTKVERNLITKDTKHRLFSNALKSKMEYRRLFKDIKNDEIYLFFTSWAIVLMSYVAKMSKRNKVYVYPDDAAIYSFEERKGITAFFMRTAVKILLGVDCYIADWSGMPVWELKRHSFPMEVVHYDKFDSELPKDMMIDEEMLKGKRLLFASSETVAEGADEKSIVSITDALVDILDNEFRDAYLIKAHPRDGIVYGKMSGSLHILPQHIIAETLMDHPWDYVVGYYTEVLSSAKVRTTAKVISLVHLWKWNNPGLKRYWIDRFKKEGILMPESMDELKGMLDVK